MSQVLVFLSVFQSKLIQIQESIHKEMEMENPRNAKPKRFWGLNGNKLEINWVWDFS